MRQRHFPSNQILIRLALGLTAVIGSLLPGAARLVAQTENPASVVTWSRPIDISNTPQSSGHPAIVADGFGNVHVFWSENVDGEPSQPAAPHVGDALFHRRWDGTNWSPNNDVIYMPDDGLVDFPAVAVGPNNYLHVVWTGLSNIYYANAPAWEADSARAWSSPVVIAPNSARSGWESSIAADSKGHLHIIYLTRGNDAGAFYVDSADGGNSWSSPIKLSRPLDQNETSLSKVRIVADPADRLHAIWQTDQQNGFGQAIYYARSTDGGQTWSPPLQMGYKNPGDFDVGNAYLTPRGTSELHLIYNAGANRGRYHRVSHDGGETWSEPAYILDEMEGINGYNVPLVDGAGHLHLVINMRTIGQVFGMFYSQWLGTSWAAVTQIASPDPPLGAAHYTAAVVNRGNEIHVVWNDIHNNEIVYMRGAIQDIAAQPVLPEPTVEVAPTPIPTETISIRPVARHAEQTFVSVAPPSADPTNFGPLVAGIGATLGLVAVLAILRRAHTRFR